MNTLSITDMNLLYSLVTDLDGSINPTYSGRGMYGQTCLGISLHRTSDFVQIAIDLAVAWSSIRAKRFASSFCEDQLGKGVILYFPGWQPEAAWKSPDEED